MNLYRLHSQPDQLLGYAQASTQVPEIAWALSGSDGPVTAWTIKRKRQLESLWAQYPKYSYRYARKILEGRFPAGEAVIVQDPGYAHYYALYILKRRWPEAEPVIASNSFWASEYAEKVLHDPYPRTWDERYLAGETQ